MLPLLRDYADRAASVMEAGWYDYLETGSGEEISLREAESAWRGYRLRPRVLRPVPEVSTAVEILGTALATPVLVAPTARHEMCHIEAEAATARGTAAAGSLMVVSTRASMPLTDIAAAAGPWWFQVYLTQERVIAEGMAMAAAELGASALVLTGDTPVVSIRTRSRTAPPDPLVNARDHLAPGAPPSATGPSRETSMRDIGRLAELTGLPVLVKGVLRADDAVACLDAGAAGLVVSNHGARQLDRAVATAHALPEIIEAVAGRAPVLVDGGIRSGIDVLVAIALGADAVMVGRPALWGLAAGGADGVRAVLDALTDDLAEAMTLLGATRPADVCAADVTLATTDR